MRSEGAAAEGSAGEVSAGAAEPLPFLVARPAAAGPVALAPGTARSVVARLRAVARPLVLAGAAAPPVVGCPVAVARVAARSLVGHLVAVARAPARPVVGYPLAVVRVAARSPVPLGPERAALCLRVLLKRARRAGAVAHAGSRASWRRTGPNGCRVGRLRYRGRSGGCRARAPPEGRWLSVLPGRASVGQFWPVVGERRRSRPGGGSPGSAANQ